MTIRSLFDPSKDIYRTIEKVITYGASTDVHLKAEISEYVVTESIEEQFRKLLDRIQLAMESGGENEVGVWVSGFYGSGKSSFTKYLGLAFDDQRTIDGTPFIKYLQDRLHKAQTKALLSTVARRFPAAVVMLDLASEMLAGATMEDVSTVLYFKVLQWAGYSRNFKVAAFERMVEKNGRTPELHERIAQALPGATWVRVQNNPLAIDGLIPKIAHEMYPALFPEAKSFSSSTEGFFQFEDQRVQEMIDIVREKSGKQNIIVIVDEVGQYVASRENLILNLDGLASGATNSLQGLDRIVREQAFTVLNRMAALRMAEARGLLVESVGKGFQARGFQLYARLAGTGLGETGDAYRMFLFSVFDELAQDLPGLFDRYSPQGRLFPREAALLQVLSLIADADLDLLWSEDETIGWIYQYFNSKEERKTMRDASQAPRNSRELAVRNQFFTPRYVVEFLVDNTLGRLWFNATGGDTHLRERCQYLLVKPDETPQPATKLRDPRTLKLLDPACGSMHFGLHAFDLFAEIYREAWAWEQQHGPGSLDVMTQPQAALEPLIQTYEDEAAFLRDVPRLIIEHNIYGVDIDPRAAQIASLALWLRAQRAWHDAGVKAKDRPLIGRGHVIAAIAPPAERELQEQFAANLDKRDTELFEKTLQLLKGLPELGVLLQVERELPHLVRQVYVGKGTGLFAAHEQESWQQAEARLREALTEYAQAAKSTYQGRLFAQDALQGLRLIDLCREVFDVVVMNPPFGALTSGTKSQLARAFPRSKNDLLAIFVERGLELLRAGGRLGAITSRTCFFLSSFQKWREQVVLGIAKPEIVADLGHRVMDDAMVEAAAYVLEKGA